MTIGKGDIHFLFVRTRFASNLGLAVRALKNMGFENLILVAPQCEIGLEARSRAMKGADILDRARLAPSLEMAAADLDLLFGATGRFREPQPALVDVRTLAVDLLPRLEHSSVGIVFGPEDNGLAREEIRLCHWLVEIPTGSEYWVMNLAQAAAVIAYELHMALTPPARRPPLHRATREEVRGLMDSFEAALKSADVPPGISLPRLMLRLRRIAARTRLEKEDVNLWRGLVAVLQRRGDREQ
jgi:TrmH family RNA methyltransferase